MVVHYLEPQRQLALAEAGLGNHAEAVRMLDALLAEHGAQDQPLLIGLLHKARAEVALSMNDAAGFDAHFAEMERCFRRSRNPALIAQIARTAKLALAAGQDTSEMAHQHAVAARFDMMRAAPTLRSDVIDSVRALYDISLPADRAAMALALDSEGSRSEVRVPVRPQGRPYGTRGGKLVRRSCAATRAGAASRSPAGAAKLAGS